MSAPNCEHCKRNCTDVIPDDEFEADGHYLQLCGTCESRLIPACTDSGECPGCINAIRDRDCAKCKAALDECDFCLKCMQRVCPMDCRHPCLDRLPEHMHKAFTKEYILGNSNTFHSTSAFLRHESRYDDDHTDRELDMNKVAEQSDICSDCITRPTRGCIQCSYIIPRRDTGVAVHLFCEGCFHKFHHPLGFTSHDGYKKQVHILDDRS
jgi:hypothetical protein